MSRQQFLQASILRLLQHIQFSPRGQLQDFVALAQSVEHRLYLLVVVVEEIVNVPRRAGQLLAGAGGDDEHPLVAHRPHHQGAEAVLGVVLVAVGVEVLQQLVGVDVAGAVFVFRREAEDYAAAQAERVSLNSSFPLSSLNS